MAEKYVVSILRKNRIDDDNYVFNYIKYAIGEIDEDNVFIDKDGKRYPTILKTKYLKSHNQPYVFSNAVKTEDLMDTMGVTTSFEEAIGAYDYYFKRIISCIQIREENVPYLANFDYDFLTSMNDDKPSEEEYKDTIKALNDGIAEGKYSLEMLRDLRAIYQEHCESSEAMVLSLDVAIDAKLGKESPNVEENQTSLKVLNIPKNKRKDPNRPIDIRGIFNKVTKSLIAQDAAAERVITEIARKELIKKKRREAILLTGSTGVGKTYLMSLIAKEIDRPFHKIDATQITIAGYVGKNIEEELWELYLKCGKDKKKAENAIVFFDEIDKKGTDKNGDINGKGVINALLPFIEGATYTAQDDIKKPTETVRINTENMIVVLGGAFTNVYKNLRESNNVGFGGIVTSEERYREATVYDFVKYGLMPDEFMGRVTIVRLNDLNEDDLKRVLLEGDESAIQLESEAFRELGTEVVFTPEYINGIVQAAVKNKTGARGMNSVINKSIWRAFKEVYCNPDTYSEVILDAESLEDDTAYQLVKK
ncbi:MAG: AAA family ATPase [Bacilli bacterium]|nr:AAA family ATPase [Bacilli bacterium]